MERRARVIRLAGENRAVVQVERTHACSGDCAGCGGCFVPGELIEAEVDNPIGAKPEDIVALEAPRRLNLWAALAYLLPVALMIGFYFLPAPREGVRIALSVLGLVTGVAICRFAVRRAGRRALAMTITRVIATGDQLQ